MEMVRKYRACPFNEREREGERDFYLSKSQSPSTANNSVNQTEAILKILNQNQFKGRYIVKLNFFIVLALSLSFWQQSMSKNRKSVHKILHTLLFIPVE